MSERIGTSPEVKILTFVVNCVFFGSLMDATVAVRNVDFCPVMVEIGGVGGDEAEVIERTGVRVC